MSVKEQLIKAGWTVKEELFEGNRQRPEDLRKQLLDVSFGKDH